MLVIPYCRMYLDPNDTDIPMPFDAQRDCITQYCDAHNLQIDTWYFDRRLQAGKEYWPVLNMILFGQVWNPPLEAVVVARWDILAPSIQCYYYYRYMLASKNIQLFCVSEDVVGSQTGIGYVYKAFLEYAAAEEQRLKPFHRPPEYEKLYFPQFTGESIVPYGYILRNAEMVIHPEQAECVREIYRMKDEGLLLRDIRAAINKAGYKTKRGTRFDTMEVRDILDAKRERIYRGERHFHDDVWIPNDHEPILKDE